MVKVNSSVQVENAVFFTEFIIPPTNRFSGSTLLAVRTLLDEFQVESIVACRRLTGTQLLQWHRYVSTELLVLASLLALNCNITLVEGLSRKDPL